MISVLLASAVLGRAKSPSDDAHKIFVECLQRYQKLTSFSMIIRHEQFWGQFPGIFGQSLRWTKDHFDLRVIRKVGPNDMDKKHPFLRAPNYRASGSQVVCLWPDRHVTMEPPHPTGSDMPTWEATGGLILSFLQHTATAKLLVSAPSESGVSFAFGPMKKWQGHDVRETVVQLPTERKDGWREEYMFDTATSKLLGIQTRHGKQLGSNSYTKQVDNPVLSDRPG
jgi:hypothetical protein